MCPEKCGKVETALKSKGRESSSGRRRRTLHRHKGGSERSKMLSCIVFDDEIKIRFLFLPFYD
jgi:hypothetical protein